MFLLLCSLIRIMFLLITEPGACRLHNTWLDIPSQVDKLDASAFRGSRVCCLLSSHDSFPYPSQSQLVFQLRFHETLYRMLCWNPITLQPTTIFLSINLLIPSEMSGQQQLHWAALACGYIPCADSQTLQNPHCVQSPLTLHKPMPGGKGWTKSSRRFRGNSGYLFHEWGWRSHCTPAVSTPPHEFNPYPLPLLCKLIKERFHLLNIQIWV